jgi:hypothetical protein
MPSAFASCRRRRRRRRRLSALRLCARGGKENFFFCRFPHRRRCGEGETNTSVGRSPPLWLGFLFESIFSDILIVNFRFHRSNEKSEPERKVSGGKRENYQAFSPRSLPLHAMPCHHPRLSPFLPAEENEGGKKVEGKSGCRFHFILLLLVFTSSFFFRGWWEEREAKATAESAHQRHVLWCSAVLCARVG